MMPGQDISFQQQLAQLQAQLGQMMQPAAIQPAAVQQQSGGLDTVDGIEGARSYLGKMLAGQKHVVWDSGKALFWVANPSATTA